MSDTQEIKTMTSQERLDAYNLIINGCMHLWSKNKLQEDKAQKVLDQLIPLTKKDPYFLAHLTSWAMTNRKEASKDLQVFLTFVSTLSDADGSPFSAGSSYKKPNLRYIGWASLQMLEPKLAERVLQLALRDFGVDDHLENVQHFPKGLKRAFATYLKYREENLPMVEGIQKAGLGNVLKRLYQRTHTKPSEDVARILRWGQKDGSVEIADVEPMFEDMDDLEIAEKIREEKMTRITVLGELSKINRKISPVIAVAMLENSTPDQVVIMRATLEDAGILTDPEVKELFENKVRDAKSTLDRVANVSKNASEEVKKILKDARADKRKETMSGIGKVYIHLDTSSSMQVAVDIAKKIGAIIAEMVPNPSENFAWGTFDDRGRQLPLPQEFAEDAFAAVLYGVTAQGMTDGLANYAEARNFGADVDVFISDGGHNAGDIQSRINKFHRDNPDLPKPKAMVFIPTDRWFNGEIIRGYEASDIPVATLDYTKLTESAMVAQAVKVAMQGPLTTVDNIMDTKLLDLPEYYYSIDLPRFKKETK